MGDFTFSLNSPNGSVIQVGIDPFLNVYKRLSQRLSVVRCLMFGVLMERKRLNVDDRIKERVKIDLEISRFCGIYVITAGGSTISLIFNEPETTGEKILMGLGILTSMFAMTSCSLIVSKLLKRTR